MLNNLRKQDWCKTNFIIYCGKKSLVQKSMSYSISDEKIIIPSIKKRSHATCTSFNKPEILTTCPGRGCQ